MKIDLNKCSAIELSILRAYRLKKSRGWDQLYFAVDLHDTITQSTYKRNESKKKVFYSWALETLKFFSSCKLLSLILYTSSYQDYLEEYYRLFKKNKIFFKYLNENPDCPSTKTGDFSKKFYYNVLLDDKAGFNPWKDWKTILKLVEALEKDKVEFISSKKIIEKYLDFKIS